MDDPMSLTEVGAYEAIQSIRERENESSASRSQFERGVETGADVSSSLTHQDHMYVQRPKSIKCPQCRKVCRLLKANII